MHSIFSDNLSTNLPSHNKLIKSNEYNTSLNKNILKTKVNAENKKSKE